MGRRSRNLLNILNIAFILIAITYAKSVRKKVDNTGKAVRRRQFTGNEVNIVNDTKDGKCWMKLGSKKHINTMNALDQQYAVDRNNFAEALNFKDFDTEMYKVMLQSQGASGKVYVKSGGNANRIPSGLNLGGFCMMRMKDSVLFFHRLKLRNDTFFRLNYLHTDIDNMILTARLALNDLHLSGSYERAITDKNPSNLFYRPTFGNIIFLLRNVQYKMEGRYRFVQDKLMIENIISYIDVPEVLMNYVVNGTLQTPEKLQRKSIEEFVNKLRIDMDKWLKHYFNDYLLYYELGSAGPNKNLREYDVRKASELNKFVDESITAMRKRLFEIRCANVKIPNFQIFTINGMEIKLRDGVVRGLDSMHRRSVATGKASKGHMRKVDVVLGFSNLKVEYKYDARLSPGSTVIHGMFILTADDLTASLDISLVSEPEFVDLKFDFLEQPKPESLVVEGPINRRIANIRHLLENHIISLMSNMLYYQITMLKTLTHCVPMLIPHMDPGDDYNPSADQKDEKKEAEYAANRQDSIEIEIPGKPGKPRKRMKIQYGEKFELIDLGDILGSPTSPPDGKEVSTQDHDGNTDDVMDKQLDADTMKPALPYGLSRVDSAEVVINQNGVPKTFHIKYNESFDVNDKRNAKLSALDDTHDAENDDDATKKRSIRVDQNLSEKEAKFVLSKILRDKRKETLGNKSVRTVLPIHKKIGRKIKKLSGSKQNRHVNKQKLRKGAPVNKPIKIKNKSKNTKSKLRKGRSLSEQKDTKQHSAIKRTVVNKNKRTIEPVETSKSNTFLNSTKAKFLSKNILSKLHRNSSMFKKKLTYHKIAPHRTKKSVISKISNESLGNETTIKDKIKLAAERKMIQTIPAYEPLNVQPRNATTTKIVNNNVNSNQTNVNSRAVKTDKYNTAKSHSHRNKDNYKFSTNKKIISRSGKAVGKFSKSKPMINKTLANKLPIKTQNENKMKSNKALSKSNKIRKSMNKSLSLESFRSRVASRGKGSVVTNNVGRSIDNKYQNQTYLSNKTKSLKQAKNTKSKLKNTSKKIFKTKNLKAKNDSKLTKKTKIRTELQIKNTSIKSTHKRTAGRRHLDAPSNDTNYEMARHDSAEVEIPKESGSPSKTMHIDYKENFKLNTLAGSDSLVPSGDSVPSDVENRNLDDPLGGLHNYAMHRQDSAEVKLPGETGSLPNTVHIDYKQKFELNDKGSSSSNIDPISPEATPVDISGSGGDQAATSIENRKLDTPTDGPQNYAMERQDSAEVELPGKSGSSPKTVHIDYKQKFELNDKGSSSNNGGPLSPDATPADISSSGGDQAPSSVENRNLDTPTDGPQNYAMERQDSAEVELPGESGSQPKTMHIEYKQKFELNDKGSSSNNKGPISPDATPVDISDSRSDQATSSVENRNLDTPTNGPQNYAFERQDSAEVELPGESGSLPKTVHIDYKQKFELNNKGSSSENKGSITADATPSDVAGSDGGDQAASSVENRNLDTPADGPQNYAMERQDSAEVQLPGKGGSPSKTLHIDYKQNFKVNEKDGSTGGSAPVSSDYKQTNNDGGQTVTGIENRNLDAPGEGPQNYAMKRKDSAEVELPGGAGSPPKIVHIDYKQEFKLTDKGSSPENAGPNSSDSVPVDTTGGNHDQPSHSDVENKNLAAISDGPHNYAMQRHDSAEVEIPGGAESKPKTVHIDYKQNFEINEKDGPNASTASVSLDSKEIHDADGDQTSVIENRDLDAPGDGPQNYAMKRQDSAEVELPGQSGAPPKTVHINYQENFALNEKSTSSNKHPISDVDNKNLDSPSEGPLNYAMERQDSAEVELPREGGAPPKTVHIKYKENFVLDDKGPSPGGGGNPPSDKTSPDSTPADSSNKDPTSSDVDNRNLDGPQGGPQNYAMNRQDSAEVELPSKGGTPPKTVHINYQENFALKDIGAPLDGGGNSPSDKTSPESSYKDPATSGVEDRNIDHPSDGALNYAMDRQDSAEVELPGKNGAPPKTVHIKYKENFVLDDKGPSPGGGGNPPSDKTSPDSTPVDTSNKDPTSSDVDNRNLDGPQGGPQNYAMNRQDSAEVELPGNGGAPPKTVHINYQENFALKDIGAPLDGGGNSPLDKTSPESSYKDPATSDVEDRNIDHPSDGALNYAMDRQDSAEVELPGENGAPPKTVHINYKENFVLDDKGPSPGGGGNPPSDKASLDSTPADSSNTDPASSDVDNRNLDGPQGGPQNYAMNRQDSAEVELPGKGGAPPKTVHINYLENFALKDTGAPSGGGGNSPPDKKSPISSNKDPASSDVENKSIDRPSEGPLNYAMDRQDSAEVVLPGKGGAPPKTVHINYKENFVLNDKEPSSDGGGNPPLDKTYPDSTPAHSSNKDPASSDVDNRNLDGPHEGAKNYAMDRQDSAEVELPGKGGTPPKIVHINYNENFKLDDKKGAYSSGGENAPMVRSKESEKSAVNPSVLGNEFIEKSDSDRV